MVDQKYCRNCGTPNLPDAKFCANCGAGFVSAAASPRTAPSAAPSPFRQQPPYSPSPQSRTILGLSRKMIVVGIVAVVLLLTLGCVALMATTTTTSPTATPMEQQAQVTAAPTSEASPTAAPTAANTPTANANVVDGMEFHAALVANPPQALGSSGDTTPAAGNVYVAFDCTVKNINAPTDSNTRIGMTYWQLRDKAGNVYDPEIFVTGTPGVKTFESVDSQHGDIVHGYVFFEVPANHGDWKSLTYNDGGRNVIISL